MLRQLLKPATIKMARPASPVADVIMWGLMVCFSFYFIGKGACALFGIGLSHRCGELFDLRP